jgi:hypothetical protein
LQPCHAQANLVQLRAVPAEQMLPAVTSQERAYVYRLEIPVQGKVVEVAKRCNLQEKLWLGREFIKHMKWLSGEIKSNA